MSEGDFAIAWTAPGRQALARLPEKVATAVVEFLYGSLAANPHRVGKPLKLGLDGLHSARRGDYRVIYRTDDAPAGVDGADHEGDGDMDLTGASWRKASYSGIGGTSCVEVAVMPGSKEGSDHVIVVRDSKDPEAGQLIFTPAEWEAFTAGVRDGEFDID